MMWGASTLQGSSPLPSQRPGAKPQHRGPRLPEQEQPWKRVRDRASRGDGPCPAVYRGTWDPLSQLPAASR